MKTLTHLIRTIAALCLFSWTMALAAAEYEITAPADLAPNTLASIELSGETLRMLGGQTQELRLFDKDGQVVPWALHIPMHSHFVTTRKKVPLELKQARHLPDGQLEILCEVNPKTFLSDKVVMAFRTSVKDFEQTVAIYGTSPNSTSAQLLLDDGFIFDSSANLAIRNQEVEFRPNGARTFRVMLQAASLERLSELRAVRTQNSSDGKNSEEEAHSVTRQAFKIDALELYTYVDKFYRTDPQMQCYPCEITEQTPHAAKARRSRFVISPPVFPINGLFIHCKESNYVRKVTLSHLADDGKITVLNNSTILQISIGRSALENFLQLPNTSRGDFLLEIENDDNAPLHISTIEAQFPLYRMRFLASPELFPLKLTSEIGGTMPQYDLAALLTYGQPKEDDILLKPGKLSGSGPADTLRQKRPFHWPRPILWGTILLAGVAMAAALYSTVKKS